MIVELALQESEVEQFVRTHPNVICKSCKLETFVTSPAPFEFLRAALIVLVHSTYHVVIIFAVIYKYARVRTYDLVFLTTQFCYCYHINAEFFAIFRDMQYNYLSGPIPPLIYWSETLQYL